jgi:hypothetical protein
MSRSDCSESFDFKKIDFGKADAMNEPDLLINGFLDTEGYLDKILNGDKYFVIGQKGSGKTAIATKMRLISETEHQIITVLQMLDEFDYDGFGGVIPGKQIPEIQYNNTWEFLLALKLIESYAKEDYRLTNKKSDPKELFKALKKIGILPNNLKSVIGLFKNKEFKIDARVAQYTSSSKRLENEDVHKIIQSVVSSLYEIIPVKKHFVILDGLDSVLGKREKQYSILASLIRTANMMNHKFKELDITTRVVILCRKDVLEKLNDPNRSKYIQDSGIELNWYQSINDITNSNLYRLINLRTKNSLKKDIDVMDEFFPAEIYNKETFKYLLDNTRYTPRDLIQLMNYIQSTSYSYGATEQTIKDGINAYSESYFLMEVKDSIVGMLSNEEIETSFQAIRTIGLTEFSYQDFQKELPAPEKALMMLNALYMAGAISNIDRDNGESFRVSKFRNPNSIFNEKKMISVNPGLNKALMIHPPSKGKNY